MNSQNQYHLSFNPRLPAKNREKHTRYVPQLKNNLLMNPPWKQNLDREI